MRKIFQKIEKCNTITPFFLVLITVSLIACSRKDDLQKGVDAIEKGDYLKAITPLQMALLTDSLNPEIHFNLSLAYAHLDSTKRSFYHYLRVVTSESELKNDNQLKEMLANFLKLEPIINGNVLDTSQMLLEIFENREKYSKVHAAYFAHAYLAKGLAILAIEKALENNVKSVGFSGGVACNEILTMMMQQIVEAYGLKFLVHKAIPPGDGGLSFGQAFVASLP